jgi:hypothetical protein
VIEACGEVECDLECCGREMTVVESEGPDAWKQFAKEADPEGVEEVCRGQNCTSAQTGEFFPLPQRNGRSATRLDLSEQKPAERDNRVRIRPVSGDSRRFRWIEFHIVWIPQSDEHRRPA